LFVGSGRSCNRRLRFSATALPFPVDVVPLWFRATPFPFPDTRLRTHTHVYVPIPRRCWFITTHPRLVDADPLRSRGFVDLVGRVWTAFPPAFVPRFTDYRSFPTLNGWTLRLAARGWTTFAPSTPFYPRLQLPPYGPPTPRWTQFPFCLPRLVPAPFATFVVGTAPPLPPEWTLPGYVVTGLHPRLCQVTAHTFRPAFTFVLPLERSSPYGWTLPVYPRCGSRYVIPPRIPHCRLRFILLVVCWIRFHACRFFTWIGLPLPLPLRCGHGSHTCVVTRTAAPYTRYHVPRTPFTVWTPAPPRRSPHVTFWTTSCCGRSRVPVADTTLPVRTLLDCPDHLPLDPDPPCLDCAVWT